MARMAEKDELGEGLETTVFAGTLLKGTSGQALRSERTRSALLAAAETVFARDGFEAARIEDIACEANRTRGAFYANFANKTEVFLALRSRATLRSARAVRERIEPISGSAERHTAVMRYIVEQLYDTKTLLLQIEFKLFALRHPAMLAELSEKHLEASTSINQEELSDLFPGKIGGLQQMRVHTMAIEAVLEGFALNTLFSPEVLDRQCIETFVTAMLTDLLQEG
jgi:AcrR family transcriptional regulator